MNFASIEGDHIEEALAVANPRFLERLLQPGNFG
jgi:hypothetical protein